MIFGRHQSPRIPAAVALVLATFSSTVATPRPSHAANPAPLKIGFFAASDPAIVNMDTNWYTKYVEQKFNINISWNLVDAADVGTKATVLLESGNYPEVFYSGNFTVSQVYKYAQQGVFVPMETYFQKYAPDLWRAIQTAPGLKQALTSPDGHIYGLPQYAVCIHCAYSAKFWINQQKLRQYGLSMPKTTADFERVLQVFKQHGLAPLTGATNGWHSDPTTFLMNSFIYDDGGPANGGSYFYINNGKIAFAPVQSQWKAGLQYLHQLYSEGLIDPGAFSQDNALLAKQAANLSVGVVPWGCPQCFDANYAKDVNVWRSIAPLSGPAGVHYASFYGNNPGSPIVFAVTNKASDAQKIAVAKLVNEIATVPGQVLKMWGPTGTQTYSLNPKGVIGMNAKPAFIAVNNTVWNSPNHHQNVSWWQMGPMYQDYNYRYGQQAFPPYAADGSGAESMLQLETELNYVGLQPRYVVPGALWIDPAGLQQFTLEQTNINNYVAQWTAQFITGSKSLSSDWASYTQGVQNLGLTDYLQSAQKAMGTPMDTTVGTLFKKDQTGIKFLQSLEVARRSARLLQSGDEYVVRGQGVYEGRVLFGIFHLRFRPAWWQATGRDPSLNRRRLPGRTWRLEENPVKVTS